MKPHGQFHAAVSNVAKETALTPRPAKLNRYDPSCSNLPGEHRRLLAEVFVFVLFLSSFRISKNLETLAVADV